MFSLVFSLPRILYCSFIFCIWTTHTIVNSLVSPHQNHRYIPIISVSSIIKVILFKSFPVMSGSRLIAFACFAFSLISHHLPHTSWHSLVRKEHGIASDLLHEISIDFSKKFYTFFSPFLTLIKKEMIKMHSITLVNFILSCSIIRWAHDSDH